MGYALITSVTCSLLMQVTLTLHYDALLVASYCTLHMDSMSVGGTERDGKGHSQGAVYQMLMNRHSEKERWPTVPILC